MRLVRELPHRGQASVPPNNGLRDDVPQAARA